MQVIAESVSQNFDIAMPADEAPVDTDLWWTPPISSEPAPEASSDTQEGMALSISEEEALDSREPEEEPGAETGAETGAEPAYPAEEAPAAVPSFRANGSAQ